MRPAEAGLVVSVAFAHTATALLVTPGSPCFSKCGNTPDSTLGSELVCDENQYGSSNGIVFESCTACELQSTYASNEQTDLQWLLYNFRYTISWCIFGKPNNPSIGDNPCLTDRACGTLSSALQWQNFSKAAGEFDYCQSWDEQEVPKCTQCLLAGDYHYINNYLTVLDAACQQRPKAGSTLSVQGSPFSTIPMNITTPSATPLYTIAPDNSPISLGGKVGIAIGGLVLILFALGVCIVCNGRRRRRAFLRRLETRHKEQGWPHPSVVNPGNPRDAEMHETPMSQKPLRGWDDSPLSATETDRSFPRYFSPYSSNYNSPVSAVEAAAMQWPPNAFPSSAQEKALQEQYEQAHRHAGRPMEIGVALGGDEPSLRSKPSAPSLMDRDDAHGEAYEMHEVDSAGGSQSGGRVPKNGHAPMLSHPGYGRNSPPKSGSIYGELTEEDVRRGNAL